MKIHILLIGLLLPFTLLQAQKSLRKANKLYKVEQYAAAIPLYEAALSEDASTSTLSKLANCYRINNRLTESRELYQQLVASKRPKPIYFFYYGEVLMSEGRYDEAKKWFERYKELEPEDKEVNAMIASCESVKNISSYFSNTVHVVPFPYNSEVDDNAAFYWNGGLVFSSDRKQGVKLLKEKSGWTGRDFLQIYFSKQLDDSLGYEQPRAFSSKINGLNKNTANATFSLENTLFFSRNNNELSRGNAFRLQLYQAQKAGGRWENVEKLAFCSVESNYMHPAITPSGDVLFFTSDKPGGEGGTDIYMSTKKGDKWQKPQNLGTTINTSLNEGFPFYHPSGKLFFCSKGHSGFGGFDIFVTSLDSEGNWKKPINLGRPFNSPRDDIAIYLSEDMRSGNFTSSRAGGDDDIYLFEFSNEHNSSSSQLVVQENKEVNITANASPIQTSKTEVKTTTPIVIATESTEMLEETVEVSKKASTPIIIAEEITPTDIKTVQPPIVEEEKAEKLKVQPLVLIENEESVLVSSSDKSEKLPPMERTDFIQINTTQVDKTLYKLVKNQLPQQVSKRNNLKWSGINYLTETDNHLSNKMLMLLNTWSSVMQYYPDYKYSITVYKPDYLHYSTEAINASIASYLISKGVAETQFDINSVDWSTNQCVNCKQEEKIEIVISK